MADLDEELLARAGAMLEAFVDGDEVYDQDAQDIIRMINARLSDSPMHWFWEYVDLWEGAFIWNYCIAAEMQRNASCGGAG